MNGEFWKTECWEYERDDWGCSQRCEDIMYFRSKILCENFVKTFNKKNNLEFTPDWYMSHTTPVKVTDYDTVTALQKLFEENPKENFVRL